MIKTVEKDKKSFSLLETKNLLNSKKCLFLTFSPLDNTFLQKKMFNVTKIIYKKNKRISDIYNSHGLWNKSEHNKFIEALYLYNCAWTKIESYLKNRTYKQIRSHAQKFYLKLKSFKDEELGVDFTSPHVKDLKDIIKIIKEKESNNQNCGKLLYIISEKLSFGKTPQPRKHQDEIILGVKKENKSYDCEYKKVNRDNSKNIDSIKNTNYANNLNYINTDHIINFKEFFSDTEGKNEQVLNSLKNDNLFPTNDDSEEDNDNIFIINDKSANDLIFLQKMLSMKDNWQL